MYGAQGVFSEIPESMWAAWIVCMLVSYVVQAIALYKIGLKANVRNPWVAFIPVLQFIVFLHVIDRSGWAILLLLVPVLNLVLYILWMVKFYLAFKVVAVMIVLSIIIPIINLIMMLVVAFSKKYAYSRMTRFTA